MLSVICRGICDVVWEFGCEELVLQCVLEVREGVAFVCGCLVLGERMFCCL